MYGVTIRTDAIHLIPYYLKTLLRVVHTLADAED